MLKNLSEDFYLSEKMEIDDFSVVIQRKFQLNALQTPKFRDGIHEIETNSVKRIELIKFLNSRTKSKIFCVDCKWGFPRLKYFWH